MKRQQQQRALFLLQCVMLLVVVGTLLFLFLRKSKGTDSSLASGSESNKKEHVSSFSGQSSGISSDESVQVQGAESIYFDPNTADSATLVRVGLSPFQARNVLRYRQKGGRYHRPEDFKRLYGLTVGQWEHLAPLIRISREERYLSDVEDVSSTYYPSKSNSRYSQHAEYDGSRNFNDVNRSQNDLDSSRISPSSSSSHPFRTNTPSTKLRVGETIDLSNADTSALKTIPGVGSYYAKRIFEYGERLGGFVSLDQLNDEELSFLPEGIERYLTLVHPVVQKLRINRLTIRQLHHHPYISYPQAKQIVDRVRLHGAFKSWDELLFLSEFTEQDKARLLPYVEF